MRQYLKVGLGLAVAALFLWLSLRQVEWSALGDSLARTSWWWIIPFYLVTLGSHYLRALRWKWLLEPDAERPPSTLTLFAGLMYGYVANIAVPRLGEVVRAVYVTRTEPIGMPALLGTVVVERLIDMVFLILSLLILTVWLIGDEAVLATLVGAEGVSRLKWLTSPAVLGTGALLLVLGLWLLGKTADRLAGSQHRLARLAHQFVQGILSVKRTRRPVAYWAASFGMWLGYTAMAVAPFYAFGADLRPDNVLQAAFVVAIVGSLGIAIPSPSGLGTYHYFVSQTLIGLYAFTPADALTYALLNHTFGLIVILTAAPVLLAVNRLRKKV